MVTHLFENFLEKEEIYKQNIDFWKTIVYTLLSVENVTFYEYLTTNKKDNTSYFDGNPIYNFKITNSDRAVRIIQEEIETNDVEFSAWINPLELEGKRISELVISLELSQESVLLAIELINAWIINNLSSDKMEKYIDKLFTLKGTIFQAEKPQKEEQKYA